MQRCANDVMHVQLAPNTESHVWNAKGNHSAFMEHWALAICEDLVHQDVTVNWPTLLRTPLALSIWISTTETHARPYLFNPAGYYARCSMLKHLRIDKDRWREDFEQSDK